MWCTMEYEGCTISSGDAGMAIQCQLYVYRFVHVLKHMVLQRGYVDSF